ncbi:MAG: hypothetical protein M4579_000151 [Chaenotheca gracillima]|nr:MAG: hypothetical protein M4579_000151 [Chaenotheca gracillima]
MVADNGTDFTSKVHNDTYAAIDPATKSDLSGKYVFVTGASKGIGRATALAYAKAGVSGIAIGARSSLTELENDIKKAATSASKPVPKILSVKLDVEDQTSVDNAAKATATAFPRLDILMNNAGYLENFTPIADSNPDEWWKSWGVNMRGVYLCTRAFLPIMLKGGDKQIVNVSSIGAHGRRPGASAYQSAKFALLRFTEFIVAEYGEQGVLAFAIHPGGVMTELAKAMPKNAHHLLTDTPELAGDVVAYLTQKKRDWLAGRYISVNWDMEEFLGREAEIVKDDKLKMRMVV